MKNLFLVLIVNINSLVTAALKILSAAAPFDNLLFFFSKLYEFCGLKEQTAVMVVGVSTTLRSSLPFT